MNFSNRCQLSPSTVVRVIDTNARVRVHQAALGVSNRTTHFSLADHGTTEFRGSKAPEGFEACVHDITDLLTTLDAEQCIQPGAVGILKLNIEGGEYEVLERLLETGDNKRLRCLLIQFHRQPDGWGRHYQQVIEVRWSKHDRD